VLARTTVTGRENVPPNGPLIVVGNHVAAMEVALMMLVLDRQVEFLGSGDIPPPPLLDAMTRLYGYIPVFRGKMDRVAMERALWVLRQGGVLGVFPEGGIWRTGHERAQKGVAWLSYRAQAPILPMGFGGMQRALAEMFRFRRPQFSVRIGALIAPVVLDPGLSRRESFSQSAQSVLDHVIDLLPVEDRPRVSDLAEEQFALEVDAVDADGAAICVPCALAFAHGAALSRLLYHPTLTIAFRDRLRLPVRPFERLQDERDAGAIARAAEAVISYLDEQNPYFLAYRFGNREGGAMRDGLRELRAVALWAQSSGVQLSVSPIRRFRHRDNKDWVEQRSVGEAHAW